MEDKQRDYRAGDKVESLISGLYLGQIGTIVKKTTDPVQCRDQYIVDFFGHNVRMFPDWIRPAAAEQEQSQWKK